MSRGSKLFSGLLRLEQIVVVETVVVGHSAAVHVEPPLQLSCNDKESLILIILIIKLLDSIFHPGHMGRLKNGPIIDKAPRPRISNVIWILPSDTVSICQLNQIFSNSEAAMLSMLNRCSSVQSKL